MEHDPRRDEVIDGEILQRRSEILESTEHSFGIVSFRANPDVEILGRSHVTMGRERVRSDDQILNAEVVERL